MFGAILYSVCVRMYNIISIRWIFVCKVNEWEFCSDFVGIQLITQMVHTI